MAARGSNHIRHALEQHGVQRVAVVDFDVHHGNGSENILSGDPRVLMVGFFQHPFYPHCGTEQPAANMLNLPVARRPHSKALWHPHLPNCKASRNNCDGLPLAMIVRPCSRNVFRVSPRATKETS